MMTDSQINFGISQEGGDTISRVRVSRRMYSQ